MRSSTIRVTDIGSGHVIVNTRRGSHVYNRADLLAVLLPHPLSTTEPPTSWEPIPDPVQPPIGPTGRYQGPNFEQLHAGGLFRVSHEWCDDAGHQVTVDRTPHDYEDAEQLTVNAATVPWLAAALMNHRT